MKQGGGTRRAGTRLGVRQQIQVWHALGGGMMFQNRSGGGGGGNVRSAS